ncbi:MAG: HlyD family efflux transporter periplasmic adaptor subunit, partial [Deltaproteobacteria bacterium]|nr:HlyD family efflux transporter periplasmic adaptor subunit [Deltaproteobacteria bacterium]
LSNDDQANPLDRELALRQPQLADAKAALSAAEADLERARLDLDRTTVRAPFNSAILSKKIEQGSLVSPQESLAELVCTDEYWVRVSIPIDRLKWLSIPTHTGQPGSPATIRYGKNSHERPGRVIRLLVDMGSEGRMARLLIAVEDPLNLKSSPMCPVLLIGEYVQVEIGGRQVANTFRIPRSAYRDESTVWIVATDNTLEIRNVTPVWRDENAIFLQKGLGEGDQVIVSDLPIPIRGMRIRVAKSGGQAG